MTAGELKNKLVQRLRGPAHSDALIYQVLSHCQRLVNAHLKEVLVTASLTTTPEQLFYSLQSTGTMRVEGFQVGTTDLKRTTIKALGYLSRSWGRARAATLRLWGTVGRQVVFIYPASAAAQSVTVIGTKLLADFAAPTAVLELPDDALTPVLDLSEVILLLKERRYDSGKVALDRLAKSLGIEHVKDNRTSTGGQPVEPPG